ncbi:unnamed protein product [Cuscuta epithymum]|uniref:Uncharacterized protein n=1 Tax=Cuscuta epithymum TaxID=186058 RepID=A0AAV0EBH1_9ASTE|nr:unnamed protein product [Cuscuta epithymum]
MLIFFAHLELGYNLIGPDGSKTLAETLKFHGNVKDLMLGWCQIGAKGTEYIADMLKCNGTISSLDLRVNGLRDESSLLLLCTLLYAYTTPPMHEDILCLFFYMCASESFKGLVFHS